MWDTIVDVCGIIQPKWNIGVLTDSRLEESELMAGPVQDWCAPISIEQDWSDTNLHSWPVTGLCASVGARIKNQLLSILDRNDQSTGNNYNFCWSNNNPLGYDGYKLGEKSREHENTGVVTKIWAPVIWTPGIIISGPDTQISVPWAYNLPSPSRPPSTLMVSK